MSRNATLKDPLGEDMFLDRVYFMSNILFGSILEVNKIILGGVFGNRFLSNLRKNGIPVRVLCASRLKILEGFRL